ncbi:MAG: phosphotransferase [Caldimonas sp.]
MNAFDGDLCPRLARVLARELPLWRGLAMEPLRDTGLAHSHVRLVGCGAVARVPKQSQTALSPVDNLAYQATCFGRAAASGHTPALRHVLPVSDELPRGALLVEEIVGHAATLPQDLGTIARALARIHALPLPNGQERPPLDDASDPLFALLTEIEGQARHLESAAFAARVRRAINVEIERLRRLCGRQARPAKTLVSVDAHPGNFIVKADGEAVLVDLEKCRYSYPPLDLAHATLYTSTSWDLDNRATLTPAEVAATYALWAAECGRGAAEWCDWHLPLRRAMWLWSLTWCAKGRVVSKYPTPAVAGGEDWSAASGTAVLFDHVRDRVAHYLSTEGVERVLAEFDALVALRPFTTSAMESDR